ncbi:hypothetical protein EXS70_05190 [Candidatus Peribacteria bacterium]|nr:hypothetical protein [Candidatus Peribacteria bacterium]
MEMDPHTFQRIIRRIEQQMRCPQCGKNVPVEFPSVRMAAEDFLLLQLKCDTCDAYIVLHASMQGAQVVKSGQDGRALINASSGLQLKDEELIQLRKGLETSGGSFEKLFGDVSDADTRLA